MFNVEDETGRDINQQGGLGGNIMAEGEEIADQYQTNENQVNANAYSNQIVDDNSFHMGKFIEKIHENPKFSEKEKEISQKLDNILQAKTGKSFSSLTRYIFLANKILMLSTFTEFLFQRFDIVTLFLNLAIILIEIGIFSHKHLYKWLLILLGSLLLDAFVLLDISPVS